MIRIKEQNRIKATLFIVLIFIVTLFMPYFEQFVLFDNARFDDHGRMVTTYGFQCLSGWFFGTVLLINLYLLSAQKLLTQTFVRIFTVLGILLAIALVQLSITWSGWPYHADISYGFYISILLLLSTVFMKLETETKKNKH